MAVTYYGGNNLTCLSTDTKPTNVPDGAKCIEIDTTSEYIKKDGAWVQMTSGSDGQIPIGAMADRPDAATHTGEYYYVNDSSPNQMFFSDGTNWIPVTTNPLLGFWDGSTNESILPCTATLTGYGTPPAANSCAVTDARVNNEAWKLFDGSEGSYWYTANGAQHWAYYFGSGNGKKVNKYRFKAYANQAPTSWLIQSPASGVSSPSVSTDSDWVSISQVATYAHSTTAWSPWFTFVSYGAVEAIRMRILSVSSVLYVYEMQLVEDTRA